MAESLQGSIGTDTQEADVNQSITLLELVFHCSLHSLGLLSGGEILFAYQRSIGISSGGDWGMTSWKQRCHGDLALK